MHPIRLILFILGSTLFIASFIAYIYVKIRLRPSHLLDEWHNDFPDSHPDMLRYDRWSTITFSAAALGLALIFFTTFVL